MERELRELYSFARSLRQRASEAAPTEYRDGYLAALLEVEEFVVDRAWDEGIDLEDDL